MKRIFFANPPTNSIPTAIRSCEFINDVIKYIRILFLQVWFIFNLFLKIFNLLDWLIP